MHIACGIINDFGFDIRIYNTRTKEESYNAQSKDKSIHEIISELFSKYENDIQIVIRNDPELTEDAFIKEEDLKEYGNQVHLITEEELGYEYYLSSKVEYSVGDKIILMRWWTTDEILVILFQCIGIVEDKLTWTYLNKRVFSLINDMNSEQIENVFRLKLNQVHVVFESSEKNAESFCDSKLYNSMKSINFSHDVRKTSQIPAIILARYLISDPEISMYAKLLFPDKDKIIRTFAIEDWGFIHVPKLVNQYESRIDAMGIDSGFNKCGLAISLNSKTQIVPVDNVSKSSQAESIKKAVVTVPRYFDDYRRSHIMISDAIETAKLTNIEIIDIIEEVHADLLYHLSSDKYSKNIEHGMKIAISTLEGEPVSVKFMKFQSRKEKIMEHVLEN